MFVSEAGAGDRLDRLLAADAAVRAAGLSRSAVSALIVRGDASDAAGRTVAAPSRRVKAGESYRLNLPAPVPPRPEPEAIPLEIVHEDAHLLVVDKPAGIVVHPAPGAERGTLVNALLHHCGESLTGIGGEARPGIVHRIDKDTSGLLVVAKTQATHAGLARQFADHTIDRRYVALAHGEVEAGSIAAAIGRHPSDRVRMAVVADGKPAITHFDAREVYEGTTGRGAALATLLECRLETGRTHQIRVHAAHIGHPLIGDRLYGRAQAAGPPGSEVRRALEAFPRQALHAARLGFVHPATGRQICFESAPPRDLQTLLDLLRRNGRPIR